MPGFLFFVRFFFFMTLPLIAVFRLILLTLKQRGGLFCFAFSTTMSLVPSERWGLNWGVKIQGLSETDLLCMPIFKSPSRPGLDKWECVCVARRAEWREPVCLASLYACLLDLDYYFCLKQPIKWMLITASNGTCQSLALVLLPCLNNSACRHNESILLLDFQHDYCPSQPSLLSFKSFHAKVKTHTLNS